MSIHVALHHRTTYTYDRLVALGPQIVRLRPAPHSRTPILSYAIKVEPAEHFINWQQDPQGNYLARLVIPEKTRKFEVTVDLVADMAVTNPFDFFLEPEAETYPFAYDPSLAEEIAPFRKVETPGPLLAAWLAKVDRKPLRTIDFLVGLNARLQREIGYIVRLEPGIQTFEKTLESAKGSCRDTGWLLVAILRHLGLAARFASGYLIQLKPDEKPLEGPGRPDRRLHRSPCLVRGLPARRRLGRTRSDLRPAGGRRSHSARLHARAVERRADRGRGREERGHVRARDEGDAACARRRAPPGPTPTSNGKSCSAPARRSSATSPRPTCASPWAASRLSCRSTTWTARSGTPWRWGPRSAAWRACCSASSPIASPRVRCCISARANGIPANSCRAGHSAATGARTASRSGATPPSRRSNPSRAAPRPNGPIASPRRWPSACRSTPTTCSRPTRTPGTTCGASGGCRATSRSTSRR